MMIDIKQDTISLRNNWTGMDGGGRCFVFPYVLVSTYNEVLKLGEGGQGLRL